MNKVTTLQKHEVTAQRISNSYRSLSNSLTDKLKSMRGANNLRKVHPNDNNSVRSMIQKILLKKGGIGFDKLYYDKELSDVHESYDQKRSNFFVLTKKSEVIGTVGIAPVSTNENTCELKKIYSLDDNSEHFSQLIVQALAWARNAKYSNCEVYENNRNTEVIKALTDYGFQIKNQDGISTILTLEI